MSVWTESWYAPWDPDVVRPDDPDTPDDPTCLPDSPRPHRWPHRRDDPAPWTQGWYASWDTPTVVPTDSSSSLEELTREGAQVVTRAVVYRGDELVDEFPVIGGSVTYDATAAIARSCDVTLLGPVPEIAADPLAPAGATIRLYRGARDWTGEIHEAPLGVYGFENVEVDRASGAHLARISGFDFARYVQDARWESAYAIPSGTPVVDAIAAALQSRLPASLWEGLNAGSSSYRTPAIVWGEERENDPWADLRALAATAGMELRFGRDGIPVLQDVPDPDDATVVWDYTAGREPTYLSASKRLIGRPYNVVVARGEPPDDAPVVEATVADEDQWSGSWVGLYRRPFFMTSSYITTVQQAQQAAQGELNRRKGLAEVVSIASVPIPSLDLGQVVRAVDPDLRVDARYVIDQLSMPLRPGGPMTMTTRRRRL